MYNGNIIKQLLKERNIPNKELLKYLGYDGEGGNTSLTQIINGNPTVKRLEPVADFFKVPIDIFFNRDVEVNSDPTLETRIELLERLLEERSKRIETLEKMVEILESQSPK